MTRKLNIKTCVALAAMNLAGFVFAGGEGWPSDFVAAEKAVEPEEK